MCLARFARYAPCRAQDHKPRNRAKRCKLLDGLMGWAVFADTDYVKRMEPTDILAALRALQP